MCNDPSLAAPVERRVSGLIHSRFIQAAQRLRVWLSKGLPNLRSHCCKSSWRLVVRLTSSQSRNPRNGSANESSLGTAKEKQECHWRKRYLCMITATDFTRVDIVEKRAQARYEIRSRNTVKRPNVIACGVVDSNTGGNHALQRM